jgi:uncharacterized protein (DUF488 family)
VTVYTIGYGGRGKEEVLTLLRSAGIRAVVDVRLRPDRASMGVFAKAKIPGTGIEAWLREAGFQYFSFVELGNVFVDRDDWEERYRRLLGLAGSLLTERLGQVPKPFCLLCAEKNPEQCHRRLIAEYLGERGCHVVHIQ